MSVRLSGNQRRTPLQSYMTYAQRDALRQELNGGTTPYKSYGELVMGIVHGECKPLKVDGLEKGVVGVLLFLTQEEKSELVRLAHDADVTVTAVVRNKVFGDEYPIRKKPHNTRRSSISTKEPEELVLTEALRLLGVTGSLPQGIKYLAMLMASQILSGNININENTDLIDKAVETEEK